MAPGEHYEVSSSSKEKRPTGRVVGIIRRNWRTRGYSGSLQPDRLGRPAKQGPSNVLFCPVERRYPFVRIQTRQVIWMSELSGVQSAFDATPSSCRTTSGVRVSVRTHSTKSVFLYWSISCKGWAQHAKQTRHLMDWLQGALGGERVLKLRDAYTHGLAMLIVAGMQRSCHDKMLVVRVAGCKVSRLSHCGVGRHASRQANSGSNRQLGS